MITEFLFTAVAVSSSITLLNTFLNFIVFLSSQEVRVLEDDSSPFTLFTINVCLVLLFMGQHSAMASTTYRQYMADLGLQPISRAVYVFCSAFILQFMMSVWRPITEVSLWVVDTEALPTLWLFFHVLHWLAWLVLIIEVLVMEPLEFIGIKQVYNYVRDRYPSTFYIPQKMRQFMVHMPHTGVGCFLTVLWLHPYMNLDRVILASVLTAYLYTGCAVTEKGYQYIRNYAHSFSYTRTSSRQHLHKERR